MVQPRRVGPGSINLAWLAGLLATIGSPPSHALIVQEQTQVAVRVKDIHGRTVERKIAVATFYDNKAPPPYPVLVLNHGRSPKGSERAAVSVGQMASAARWLTSLGFLVAVPIRVGYGVTGGPDVEYSGPCEKKTYPPVYEAAAAQTLAVLQAMRTRSDTSKDRAIMMGQSFGGTAAITVAAMAPDGIQAAINFAGGGGGNKAAPQHPCAKDQLLQLFSGYGKTSRMPTLWVYSANDQLFGPTLPKDWFAAFRASGGKGEFAGFPPVGDNGHLLFSRAPELWHPRVLEFLRPLGYKPIRTGLRRRN